METTRGVVLSQVKGVQAEEIAHAPAEHLGERLQQGGQEGKRHGGWRGGRAGHARPDRLADHYRAPPSRRAHGQREETLKYFAALS